jgi:hypothetical protein
MKNVQSVRVLFLDIELELDASWNCRCHSQLMIHVNYWSEMHVYRHEYGNENTYAIKKPSSPVSQ